MAYTINLTDGNVFATISDGTINNASSMTLVGKNYAGYGELLDENFIQLLENFSSTSSGGNPTSSKLAAPLQGQLWWDKTNSLLKVYSGSAWKTISSATASSSQPSPSIVGDLWYDTTNQQLKVCSVAGNPGTFIVVGPAFSSSEGTSGAIPETVNDSGATPHFITSLYVNNTRVAIVSKDANFTPAAPLNTTFPTIYNGITLWNSGSPVFGGTVTNAALLDSLDSTDFMRATANTQTNGTLRVTNNTGLFVGAANVFNVNTTTTDANIKSNISNGNLTIQANVAGTTYNVASALGASGTFAVSNALTVGTTASVTGNITGANLVTGGIITATGNITGGNITTAGLANVNSLTVVGNVNGGNLRTGGLVSATGNITSAANVAGTYFIGNGSQLTGLSLGVSVTKFVNGTTEGNAGVSGGNINFNVGGVSNVAVIDTAGIIVTGITTPEIAKSGTNAVGNIGSSSNYFNRVFATATTALYADVAERFAADELLEPGTVVELGGTKEITRATSELSEQVFGVISTNPAYTMNGGAGDDDTHPAVAMTGRVPVKVVGYVKKGDRLVSAGNGLARAATREEITAFNVIGRSLVDKNTPESGTIEAIVTIKN
jgi:hypothetical protein